MMDFRLLVMRYANDLHTWLRHSRKPLANRITRATKEIVVDGNTGIIQYILHIEILMCLYVCVRTGNDSAMSGVVIIGLLPDT